MVFCARFTCLSVICLSTYSVIKKKKKTLSCTCVSVCQYYCNRFPWKQNLGLNETTCINITAKHIIRANE